MALGSDATGGSAVGSGAMAVFVVSPSLEVKGVSGHAVAAVGGRIHSFGGHDGESVLRQVWIFTPVVEGDAVARMLREPGPDMLARRAYSSAAVSGDTIYLVGGSSDGRALNTMETFETCTRTWESWFCFPPMNTKRTMHASVAVDRGKLFVCGGFDGMRDLKTVERYDSSSKEWRRVADMDHGRSYLAIAAAAGGIYAIGGQDRLGENRSTRAHSSVEVFDLYSELWCPVAPMSNARIGVAAAVLVDENGEEYVYAVGGSNGDDVLGSVECYDPRLKTWSPAPSLNVPRLGHACAVHENELYVLGGFDGKDPVESIERLSLKHNRWFVVPVENFTPN
eukprot:TRINITY_DN46607_c0_g1_i1.p1 TRINITY_DN46607_c0_g1~~TRINITY_DN46607_c0_g1_i1.p1  ORF type:complete len:338 (-),score=55.98 TRINITY_DN46607_c0_g1_i1:138-1151(-)